MAEKTQRAMRKLAKSKRQRSKPKNPPASKENTEAEIRTQDDTLAFLILRQNGVKGSDQAAIRLSLVKPRHRGPAYF